MKNGPLVPQSNVLTVRADQPISDCVRILRDHSVGALVVLSDSFSDEIVGIFTERDLVKHIELIHRGKFWDNPVRTVMTATVRTITPAQIPEAPKLMVRYQIRHLPVVTVEKGRSRLVGVLSMRDIFRFVMEEFDFDLGRVYQAPAAERKKGRKLMAIFSEDPALEELINQGAKMTKNVLVRGAPLHTDFDNLRDILERFDALFVDLDGLRPIDFAKVMAVAKTVSKGELLFLAFNPARLTEAALKSLSQASVRKRVHLLSKPIALGLLYEHFLKEI